MSAFVAPPRGWRPTSRAGGLLALCVLAYLLAAQSQAGWLYLAAALFAGALPLGLLYPALAVRGLRVSSRVLAPAEAPREGVALTFELHLANSGLLPRYWTVLHDTSGLSGAASHALALIEVVPSRGHVVGRWTVCPPHRGVFLAPLLRASSSAPFGLARAWAPVAATASEIVVAPRWWELPPGAATPAHAPGDARPRRGLDQGGEFFGTRPYRQGDSLRRVHWRSSARHQALVVREFERPAVPTLGVVLAAPGAGDPRTFEVAVRLAASAARWATRHGYQLVLRSTCAAPALGGETVSLPRVDDYLARLGGPAGDSLDGVLRRLPPCALALVILPACDPAALPALLALDRRGTRVTVSLGQGSPGEAPAVAFAADMRAAGLTVVPFAPEATRVDPLLW